MAKRNKKIEIGKSGNVPKIIIRSNPDFELTPQTLRLLRGIYGQRGRKIPAPRPEERPLTKATKPRFTYPEDIWTDEQKRQQLFREGRLTEEI